MKFNNSKAKIISFFTYSIFIPILVSFFLVSCGPFKPKKVDLRKIPGNEQMIEYANKHNPSGRLTTPEDIANYITLLSQSSNSWMTGNILRIDGGEDIIG